MGKLRISFGSASSQNFSSRDPSLLEICSIIKEKIAYLKTLKKDQLDRWKEVETVEIDVGGKKGLLTVYKDTISTERDLLIVQAFYPNWKSVNYISFGRVGRVFADGFFIDSSNVISDASDNDLWAYR